LVMARVYTPREMRLIAEFCAQRWPEGGYRLRAPLGPIPEAVREAVRPEKWIGAARPFRPEVDALKVEPNRIVLMEAKIFRIMDGLAKLPIYASLVPETPELERYRGLPIEMWLVVCWTAPWLEAAARRVGVRIHLFRPAWIEDYVKEIHRYWTKEYRIERAKRLGLR